MSVTNLEEFKTVEQLKQELLMVTRELKAAILTVDKLLKDANKKNERISELETLLAQNVPVISKEKDKITISALPEESIAEMQLNRLRQASENRVLTLEEVRMFDLLVKNKRLVTEASTINVGKHSYRDVSESDLVKLVATEIKNNESDSD